MRHLSTVVLSLICVAGCPPAAPIESPAVPRHTGDSPETTPRLEGKLIDLTHSYDETTIYWPTGEDSGFAKTRPV